MSNQLLLQFVIGAEYTHSARRCNDMRQIRQNGSQAASSAREASGAVYQPVIGGFGCAEGAVTNKIGFLINPGDLAEQEKQVVNGLGFAATIARIRVDLLGMDWEDAGYARRCFHIRAWQSRSTNATSWRTASSAVYSVAAKESQLKPQS